MKVLVNKGTNSSLILLGVSVKAIVLIYSIAIFLTVLFFSYSERRIIGSKISYSF